MTSWWNVGPWTYHVEIDPEKNVVSIHREDGDGKRDGKTKTFSAEEYEKCGSGFAVEALYKSKK